MQVRKIQVTPSVAKKYLESNTNNRNVKPRTLNRYAADIANGRWKEDTGELVKISKTGVVLDGQHRLLAIIKADKPAWLHVATGLDDDIFDVLDTGSKRTYADVFHIRKIPHAGFLPSIIQFHTTLKQSSWQARKFSSQERMTSHQLLNVYDDNPNFWDSVAQKTWLWFKNARWMSRMTIGGMYAHFYDISPMDAGDFMEQLCTGFGIKNRTVALLRNKLIQDNMASRKMSDIIRDGLIMKAWNNFRNGTDLKILKYDPLKEPEIVAI